MPTILFGKVSEMTVQPKLANSFAEECGRYEEQHDTLRLGIITGNNGHRQSYSRHDGRLAGKAERVAAMEKLVGKHAAKDSAEAPAETRNRSRKSDVQDPSATDWISPRMYP